MPCAPATSTSRPVAGERALPVAAQPSRARPRVPAAASPCELGRQSARLSPGSSSEASWRRIASCSRRSSGPGSTPIASHQRRPRVTVGLERVGLAARAVERQHPLRLQPLAQRLVEHEPSSSPSTSRWRPAARSRSIASSTAASRSSSSRRISAAANGSSATSASAGPRHNASASRGMPRATSRSNRSDRRHPARAAARSRARA